MLLHREEAQRHYGVVMCIDWYSFHVIILEFVHLYCLYFEFVNFVCMSVHPHVLQHFSYCELEKREKERKKEKKLHIIIN